MSEEFKTQTRETYREPWPEPQPLPRPDMLNRMMSLGALIIASAALVNSMGGWSALQRAGEVATSAAKSVDDGIDVVASNLNGGDDTLAEDTTNGAVDPANLTTGAPADNGPTETPAETAIADQSDQDAAEEDLSGDVNDLFQEPADTDVAAIDESTTSPAEPEDMIDLLDRNPRLQIVRTALMPTSELATAFVTIENSGTADAVITDAIFIPSDVDELPFDVAKARVGVTTADRLVIRFNSDDNQATKAGEHGDYQRKLSQPFKVPAGESVEVRVAIEGREYAGYGFLGDLRLKFGENENLDVSGMTIAFVE